MSKRALEKGNVRSQRALACGVVCSLRWRGQPGLLPCRGSIVLHLHVGVRMVREMQPRIAVGMMIWGWTQGCKLQRAAGPDRV